MDPSRHHDFIGSNEERSRANAAAAYYNHDVPDIAAHHHYYGSTIAATAAPPPPPPTRSLSNSRNPCDCTTTPSGGRITCNGCRLNPPGDMWQPRATSTSNALPEQHTQRGDYRQMGNEASMRTAMRPSPMYMQHQQHQQPPQQHQPPSPQQSQSHGPPHQSTMVQSHPTHVGSRSNYWPQNPSSTTQHYGDEHMMTGPSHPQNQPTSQTQIDISITRRSAAPVVPVDGSMYGQYKSASITATATHPSHSSSSYPPPSSSTNFTHQRVSAIGGPSGPVAAAGGGGSSHYIKERIYSTTTTTKIAYNTTTSSAIYDNHQHHMNNQAMGNKSSSLPIDHHVINPSNLPTSKDQHPSPNYARKCPQMYTPEAEQSTAHHHNLYMPTPQFSSDKFSRASPQQMPPDYTKLRESPLQSSAGSPYMSAVSVDKYNHVPPTHLRESPQFVSQQPTVSRNSNSYYAANQNPSKVHPPEMSPIIMTQSHTHYQYSKSPLPPPLPPSVATAAAAAHQIHQIPPAPNMGAKSNSSSVLAPPPSGNPPSTQRYIVENVKREDLEIYETNPPMQQQSARNTGSGIYINPYNTPPPTGDSCCKDVAPLSTSSSPYTTGSATPNYRVESPQFYPTKYGKISMTESSSKHSLINQNTPPPSRAPSQRGHQQPAYYYESNPHSAPSPAAATAASPSPSSLLPSTTTTSQNQIHHTEYVTTLQQGGPIGPPPPGHTLPQSYPTQPTAQHQSTTASLRNNDLIVGPQNSSPYERIIPHPHHTQTQPPTKHPAPQQNSSMQAAAAHHASKLPATAASNKQKPNYRELINRTLAMRKATSEEQLNRHIINKTLNIDTQNKRVNVVPPTSQSSMVNAKAAAAAAALHQQSPNVNERLPLVREPIRTEITTGQTPSKASMGSVLVNHHTTAALLPRTETSRICIKQEDDKPSSSTTASSPLDLSMRTVKTKADSTEYKYQQRRSTPSSTEGRYTLPRVDSTPVFSVHAFEPAVPAVIEVAAATGRQNPQNSRHNSVDRRNYTPPTPAAAALHPPSISAPVQVTGPYPSQSSTQHGQSQYPQRRNDLQLSGAPAKACYETLCVIKTAPKPVPVVSVVNNRDVRSNISQTRPSVLETNPYASVIKTEPKRLAAETVHVPPVKAQAPTSSTQHTLTAVERLPPDTSIMPLPPRNAAYAVQRALPGVPSPVPVSTGSSITPPSYLLGCERNPNFRKRHIQEYSSQMSAGDPVIKQARYIDSPTVAAKPQLPMRPADISVIAVNETNQHELERCNTAKQLIDIVPVNTGVIASTVQPAKVIVNNHNHSPSVVVCKQEPMTPAAEIAPPKPEIPTPVNHQPTQPNSSHMASARIRTKAELKGFTFNPPPLTQTEIEPPPVVAIKQEEELTIKVKEEEPEINLELPVSSIPGLEDNFAESNLLDCGWNNKCKSFLEQLLSRPDAKKKITSAPAPVPVPAPVVINKPIKDVEMVVSSTDMTCRKPLDNHFSNMESADTTRSSFARLDGLESGMTLKSSMNQDTVNSPATSVIHKKLTKTEREKKRFQQEKRLAERLQAKESSSETEDELDKRKTERLKKPLMKSKNKLKTKCGGGGNSNDNNSSSTQLSDKNRFSDCGSDSSSGTDGGVPNSTTTTTTTTVHSPKKDSKNAKETERNFKTEKENNEKCDKSSKDKMDDESHTTPTKAKEGGEAESGATKNKKSSPTKDEKMVSGKKPITPVLKRETKKVTEESSSSSSESSDEEDEADDNEEGQEPVKDGKTSSKSTDNSSNKINNNSAKGGGKFKVGLNTMTRSKLKKELELQLANSKVLRNDKIIRNSTTKIKRKYVRKYVNNVNSYLESGGLSRESGIIKSTRLKAKLERKGGGVLNLLKKDHKSNKLGSTNNKDALLKNAKNENVHDRNDLELYRFKRALKVPPSLINIKHPGAHKIAASLPDLERHAEALDAYAKKKKKSNFKSINKQKNDKSAKTGAKAKSECVDVGEPRSIIDVLHSKVTKASGLNVRNISTSTTASKPSNKTCTVSTPKSYSGNNCSIFSETSQTTESSELQMLPPLRHESEEEEDDDNESANGGKKRHFSIFDTTVLPTKTRTESKLQQKRENIREIFVGDDRPASAPPEMTQVPDTGGEKMTYEQKYEQFLQKMNIVISADKSGRFSRTAAARKLIPPTTHLPTSAMNIKQEEVDTEGTSVMDPDELKDDQKSECCHISQLRKKRGKYLRRKGSSGFDYIRKKKKPTSSAISAAMHNHNSTNSSFHHVHIKSEKMDVDEYENKVKTEDDVSREIQKWVLNKGVGQSTMHKAARQGYMDVIVYCLDRMAMKPDQKDNAGYTPLHEACTNGWLDIARVLLQYGANHSAAAHSGIRPLHEASENDNEEIVRLLLSYGADPLLATYSGQTPLMLASSTTMRDILNNHLVDVQSMGPDRKPWRFNGPWEIYDASEWGYNVFEGAPNPLCDMSRALLRRGSLTNNQMLQNKKLQLQLQLRQQQLQQIVLNTTNHTAAATSNANTTITTTTTTANTSTSNTANASTNQISQNGPTSSSSSGGGGGGGGGSCSTTSSGTAAGSATVKGIETQQQQQQTTTTTTTQQPKGETTTKTVMDKCAVVLDKIDRFNSVRLNNDNNDNKPEILVENSDSDGEMFEFEEADVLLPPLYLLKDEGTNDKWVLLNDLCNLLKVKSKDTLLNKINPPSSSAASGHKSLTRELKMSDFLEKATCLQLLCAGEKLNICASKVVLIKYNEKVRNLLGVKTILMKF